MKISPHFYMNVTIKYSVPTLRPAYTVPVLMRCGAAICGEAGCDRIRRDTSSRKLTQICKLCQLAVSCCILLNPASPHRTAPQSALHRIKTASVWGEP